MGYILSFLEPFDGLYEEQAKSFLTKLSYVFRI